MTKNTLFKSIFLILVTTLLSSCNGFFDKDNTPTPFPLVQFPQQLKLQNLWMTNTGGGTGDEYLKLVLAQSNQYLFSASRHGYVAAIDKCSGRIMWSINTHVTINAGPGAGEGIVVVASNNGQIIALRQQDGAQLWIKCTASEILAPPTIKNGVVIIKAIDGKILALSAFDGHELWNYQQVEPVLILRSGSAPLINADNALMGFANGNIIKLSLHNGDLRWQQTVGVPEGAFAIERMVDIDADPIIVGNRVFVATYQGRIASLNLQTGQIYWSYDLSSFTGIASDGIKVYVSDAKSHIWAFDAISGKLLWQQCQLESRNITGPAIIGNYIVVGDLEGYLHWLNKQDGHFVARIKPGGYAIRMTPLVDQNAIYVLTIDGRVAAYTPYPIG